MEEESGPMSLNVSSFSMSPQNRPDLPSLNLSDSKSAWFMQRPRTPGVDLTAFSFAKPASHRQGFALRNLPKHAPINVTGGEIRTPLESQNVSGDDPMPSIAQTRYGMCIFVWKILC